MRRGVLNLILCCLGSLVSLACSKSKDNQSGGKHVSSQNREVSGFNSIYFNGYGDLYVSQEDEESLKIVGETATIGQISTNVIDGVLHIDFKSSNTPQKINMEEPVKIYVKAKLLQEIRLSGSGSIFSLTPLKVQTLKLSISGSGNADLRVVGHRLFTVLSGYGNFVIKGIIENQDIWISGSGFYRAEELTSRVANINISGTGKVFVNVQDDLEVHITGNGSVIYQGSPRLQQRIVGAGIVNTTTVQETK